ncbi:MAG: PadR family transcriptional regulator [Microbacteriaceae bacterium]|nr:PadR family transcriptional regulator [Microbacteriaceae bacterium]MCL2794907.1 PadR family transcriptional regulator [Microbacteriaceae bacterium]
MRRRKVNNLLALAVLSGLVPQPAHPYELARTLRQWNKDEDLGFRWGSYYTVIGNLAKHGLIEPVGTERAGTRPERTVYRLTPAGRDELVDWVGELLSEVGEQRPRFVAGLSVMAILPPAEVLEALRMRATQLERTVGQRRGELEGFRSTVPRLFLIEDEFQLAQLESELAWVKALVGELEAGTFPEMDEWARRIDALGEDQEEGRP